MEQHRRTFFTRRGIAVRASGPPSSGGPEHVERDLIAGELHYWRLDPRDWQPCLAAMRDLGVTVVSTYVPWGVHEIRPGRYDWSQEFNLARFLDVIGEQDMAAIVRPGPHINAELTFFGFPERILKDPDMQAVTGRGTPAWLPAPARMFPVPSYASQAFQEQVRTWFAAVGEIVAPRLAPDGPVIAVQVDNEAQMFFRLGAYDLDYHADALAWWHEFADGAEPPRAWSAERAGACARWVHFKDEYTARSLTWLGQALDAAGMTGVARYHNLPPSEPSFIDLPRTAAAGALAGMDFYHQATDYRSLRRRSLYLAGSAEPLSFAPEVGVGGPLWLPPMSPSDQQNTLLALLSAGVRAFNLYMLVERERWYGAAIDNTGAVRPESAWLGRLLASLAEVGWTELARPAPVALIWSRAEARFAVASSVADPITPVLAEFLQLGPAGAAELALDESAAQHRRWQEACQSALDLAQIPYDIVDAGVPLEKLTQYRAVIAPTLTRVDRQLWRGLRALSAGGAVVVVGPEVPTRDEYDAALGEDAGLPANAGLIQPQSMADINGFADDLAAIAGELPEEWSAETDDTDCSLFVAADARPAVLFVGNRSAGEMQSRVVVPPATRLVDAVTDEVHQADADDCVEISLSGYQTRMFLVDRPD